MAATVRNAVQGTGSSNSLSIGASGLTTAAGDILYLFTMGYTSFGAPSGSDVTWSLVDDQTITSPYGATGIMAVRRGEAPDNALSDFTMSHGATDQWGYILVSVQGADTTTPEDAWGVGTGPDDGSGSAADDPVAPSVSPTGTDSLLLCVASLWMRDDPGAATITVPSGMTALGNTFGAFDYYRGASLGLSASGATGTKTFDNTAASPRASWIAYSVAVKTASAGTTTRRYTLTTLGVG